MSCQHSPLSSHPRPSDRCAIQRAYRRVRISAKGIRPRTTVSPSHAFERAPALDCGVNRSACLRSRPPIEADARSCAWDDGRSSPRICSMGLSGSNRLRAPHKTAFRERNTSITREHPRSARRPRISQALSQYLVHDHQPRG